MFVQNVLFIAKEPLIKMYIDRYEEIIVGHSQ